MVRQPTPMRKLWIGILLCASMLLMAGCTKAIPEGDIKDFVDKLDFDLAYQQVSTGKSTITATYTVDGTEDGKVSFVTYIDKKDLKYHYMITEVSGSYFGTASGQYGFYKQEVLSYMNPDDTASVFKKTDGEEEEISYRPEDVTISVNNFFYQELEAGYHRGGVYYGDYILANCGKYYSCFSLNEEKTELTYQVNTSTRDSEGNEILTLHHFTVDQYGMILTLSSKSINVEKNIEIETTIFCEYNIPIEKKLEL